MEHTLEGYEAGDVCARRDSKPGERWDRRWTTSFPVKLSRPFHIEGHWWVDDAEGRRVWMAESDLVVIRRPR